MTTATLLRRLRRDPDVIEARMFGDTVAVRLRHGAGSEAYDRVQMLLYGEAPTLRRMRVPPPEQAPRRPAPVTQGRGRAA